MKKCNKWIGLGLLLVALVLVNFIGGLFRGQADLTENALYTLSEGSRNILAKIEEPVTLQFYFSRSAEGAPVFIKNYATLVEDLLHQYESAAGDKIRLEVINPRPDTSEEEAAIRAGITGQPLPTGETLFFGLAAIQADQEEVIPMFNGQREEFLEFDISQLIHQVQQLELPRLGIVSGLDIFGQPAAQMFARQQQGQDAWVFVQELRNQFEVEQVNGDELPDDLDVLAVVHPQDISSQLLFEIDQFLLSGKPVFMAVDPSSFVKRSGANQQQMMMGMTPPTSSDLPQLFSTWKIEYDASMVVGDPELATGVNTGRGQPVPYPVWLTVSEFNTETPPTAQLNQMLLPEAGSFQLGDGSELELVPLISTTPNSGKVMGQTLAFTGPDQVGQQLESNGEEQVVAGIVRGKFPTAFPDGRPSSEDETPGGEETESEPAKPTTTEPALSESTGASTLVLVADTDFLSNQFSVQIMNFAGMRAMTPLNDNLAFASNVVEFLAGSEDLISLRGKGTSVRPFERVREMEITAQQKYEERLTELEERLREVQENLREIQQQQGERGQLVASPEVRETIENFRLQEAEMRAERREIRKRLREDIEGLKLNLVLANLLIVPALVGIFGINFFILRNRKQKR